MSRIEVAVGLIHNIRGEFLVGQRTVVDRYFRKWEFPGGKLETDELANHALVRELQEELGISVVESESLMTLEHDYPDRKVLLHVYRVLQYQGVPVSAEGQALRWVAPEKLAQLDFLEGNQAIISYLLKSPAGSVS